MENKFSQSPDSLQAAYFTNGECASDPTDSYLLQAQPTGPERSVLDNGGIESFDAHSGDEAVSPGSDEATTTFNAPGTRPFEPTGPSNPLLFQEAAFGFGRETISNKAPAIAAGGVGQAILINRFGVPVIPTGGYESPAAAAMRAEPIDRHKVAGGELTTSNLPSSASGTKRLSSGLAALYESPWSPPPIPLGGPWEWKSGSKGDLVPEDPESGGFDRGFLPRDTESDEAFVGLPCDLIQRIRFRTRFAFSDSYEFYAHFDDQTIATVWNPNSLVGKFPVEVLDLISAGGSTYGAPDYFRGTLPAFITASKVNAGIESIFKRHHFCPAKCKIMQFRALGFRIKAAVPLVTFSITNPGNQLIQCDFQMVNDPKWGWSRVPVRCYYRHYLKMTLQLSVTLDVSAKIIVRCK